MSRKNAVRMSRELNLRLNRILNDWVPPAIRDSRWFGSLLTRVLFGDKAHLFMNFHARAFEMSDAEIKDVYEQLHGMGNTRPTDLNLACIEAIRKNIIGQSVLEVGCGRGYLSNLLTEDGHAITACDVAIADKVREAYPNIHFDEAYVERLPYADNAFDTVISTHMLEHIRNLPAALAELRRVTAKRLIIVVPRERPHYYTPNLHLHFFPYRYSLLLAFWPKGQYHLSDEAGDWFYWENKTDEA